MTSVSLQDVCVELAVYNARGRALKTELMRRTVGGRIEDRRDRMVLVVQALRNVNLEVRDGERVGVIGGNGAGKTTLLRVLSRVYKPTGGQALIHGRISSLIELTMGMDAEASGYENIILRGVMLGLDPKSAQALTDEVAEFSELGEFLALPIRTYSSGMLLRLAFAVATAVQPEIAIFDELIGVGDAAFAGRAEKRLERMIANANIMFLASHNADSIRRFCNRAIWMAEGQIRMDGRPEDVLAAYHAAVNSGG
jgi:ABC-type polysaccharide/polyol phosphate transport system ATPase subunit